MQSDSDMRLCKDILWERGGEHGQPFETDLPGVKSSGTKAYSFFLTQDYTPPNNPFFYTRLLAATLYKKDYTAADPTLSRKFGKYFYQEIAVDFA